MCGSAVGRVTNDRDGSYGEVVGLRVDVARASLATPLREAAAAVPIDVIPKTRANVDHPLPNHNQSHAKMVAYGITYNCEQ